ncbi:MAG: thymidylate synthase [Christensenellaceae bacterium]|jgi:thymidylate synthase|nr:thymidylate synthase [Christensenellaceae bacterium]
MITKVENVGFSIYGDSIGELWLNLVETVLKNGAYEMDENRGRFAVRNLRFAAGVANSQDILIEKYGDKKKIDAMKKVVFESDVMVDFDIKPSFRNGAKSYKKRIEEGKMIEFVVGRLSKIPESKKAVMVFPTYEDYNAVLTSPWNDYLPCITALQFRVNTRLNKKYVDLTLFMRSWDGFQKGAGDLTVVSMLGDLVRNKLEEKLKVKLECGRLDGLVTDIHIYENAYENAQNIHFDYKNERDI